jgi:hypothetical protein
VAAGKVRPTAVTREFEVAHRHTGRDAWSRLETDLSY